MVKAVVLLLAFFGASLSQVIVYQNCPDVQVVENFNLTGFLGTWYHFSRYWDYGKINTRCNSATYSSNPNGSIDVLDQNIYIPTEKHQKMRGVANLEGNGTEGKMNFSYPPTKGVVAEYLILATDYENWATIWSCLGRDTVGSVRYVWLYSRDRNPSEETINATITALQKYGIPTDILISVSQENCTAEV